ncbi:hypothetical protein SmJEL517_g01744 [Synchytrium microbalum]|uniref:3-hydroxyisobutyryl-CoA hydrolase n=1 Tax=Synchytrium microbalum TaxID=1806994 RepID=A0A507CEI3_9FUNG|nr:uncharacterized protein SmJEL517_g01744 [Synchytrium microbalum]TPX35923.1 hypothetical protein SmJEL517_g01744 [Synchytrium microbalum]
MTRSTFHRLFSSDTPPSGIGTIPFVEPPSEIIPLRTGSLRATLLNRPKALNALSLSMMKSLTNHLTDFDRDLTGMALMISKYGECRAFCSGGDAKSVATYLSSGDEQGKASAYEVLTTLYKTCHAIGTLNTPLVVVMDGYTMGGGLGLSVHAPIRVATENTSIWVPEGSIGLFPDSGVAWFLARGIDGPAVGSYLALTGRKINGMEAVLSGFATHFVPSDRLPAMIDALSDLRTTDLRVIDSVIEDFVGNAPSVDEWSNWAISGDVRDGIERCFNSASLGSIVKALDAENSLWSSETLKSMQAQSPTAMKVTAELVHRAQKLDFASFMKLEQRLAWFFTHTVKDFATGTAASRLQSKQESVPAWSPTWEEVIDGIAFTDNDVKIVFGDQDAKIPEDALLPPLTTQPTLYNTKTFQNYIGHTVVGVPSEEDVRKFITGEASGAGSFAFTRTELIDWFAANWGAFLDQEHLTPISVIDGSGTGGSRYIDPNYDEVHGLGAGGRRKRERWGVRQRIESVVNRRCSEKDGYLKWKG